MKSDDILNKALIDKSVDVAAWCAYHAKHLASPDSLRSPELQPISAEFYRQGLLTDGDIVVEEIAAKRRFLLRSSEMPLSDRLSYLKEGRFLVYQPDASFADALAEYQSNGFFDKWDAPPWDTWVGYSPYNSICDLPFGSVQEGILLSWVPPSMQKLAQSGIDVQPFGAIKWLEDTNIATFKVLEILDWTEHYR